MSHPRHVAVIMDGNGRWAVERGLSRLAGHKAGMIALHRIIRHVSNKVNNNGLEWLTVYAFSKENWLRPMHEVNHLMELLRLFIKRDLAEIHANNVRIRIIGDRVDIPPKVVKLLEEAENVTAKNTGLNLTIAFNYSGRDELTRALTKLASFIRDRNLDEKDVNAEMIGQFLDTANMPDPDLIIRTSGEQRISNFLLWQSAYSELYFSPCFWPDFDESAYDAALADFYSRERRFGAISQGSEKRKAQ